VTQDLGDYKQYEVLPPDANGRCLCEFWCHCCDRPGDGGGYVYVKLNTNLEGNHVINCPNCGHKHYRVVKEGIITDCRFHTGMEIADEIIPMKSAFTRKRRTFGAIAQIRQAEAVGRHT
jgi:hypothetical protein